MSYNFWEGQYVIISVFPRSLGIRAFFQSPDLEKAKRQLLYYSRGDQNTFYALRLFLEGKFWEVSEDGSKSEMSLQQDWKLHPHYLNLHFDEVGHGGVLTCHCSYPYFASLVFESLESELRAASQPMTCLQNDSNRDIIYCPNCGTRLYEEVNLGFNYHNRYKNAPVTCVGCSNYNGSGYKGQKLICAIHPYGYDGEVCPDYTA